MTSHDTIFMQRGHEGAATELKAALAAQGLKVTETKLNFQLQVRSEPGEPLQFIPASSVSYLADDVAPLIPLIMTIEEKHLKV